MFPPRPRLCLALALLGALTVPSPAWSDTIVLKDGSRINDVSRVRDADGVIIYRKDGRAQSLSAARVQRIVGADGEVLFEQEVLLVREERRSGRPSLFTFTRNGTDVATAYWGEDGIFRIHSGRIPDGLWRQFYDSGKIRREFSVREGQLNGVCKVYFESGKLEREGTFVDGRENGESRLYYPSGNIRGVSAYRNGRKHGPTRLYYESGSLHSEMAFREGEPHGEQKVFYESGATEARVHFERGVKQGPIRKFYESGQLKLEGEYVDGALEGEVIAYYESGRVKKRQYFDGGRVVQETALVPQGRVSSG
jgi:antitoxin component YwqK of YwqJK toxin-antitoxin module